MRKKSLLFFSLIFILSSCNTILKRSIDEKYLESSSEFKDILALKYLRYSDVLMSYHDYSSSEHFAKLARQANKGETPIGFKLDDYMLEQSPQTLADLHFLFNCWYYYETNNKNLGEASICKDSFYKMVGVLEQKRKNDIADRTVVQDLKKDTFSTDEEESSFADLKKTNKTSIYFDFDSFKLNPEAVEKMSGILKYLKSLNIDYRLTIIGHTDRAGKAIYNNTLARRRANTVFNVLNKNGVPRNIMNIKVASSVQPQILTKKNTKFQDNRRVEIIIDTDFSGQDILPQPHY